jgi:hypothetical protein
MNKNRLICLALILFSIALCGALYHYQTPGTVDNSTTNVTADINSTPTPTKNQNETTNTTNQTAFTVPLEKPPFI